MEFGSTSQNKWIICRICLKNSPHEMLKIFERTDLDLVAKIEECGGVVLSPTPNLPDSICKKCLLLLKVAAKFREKVQRSQTQLNEKFILQTTSNSISNKLEYVVEEDESQEFYPIDKTEINDNGYHKSTNTEFITPDETTNAGPLVYSVQYQETASEIIQVETSNGVETFENDKLIDYVDQDIEDLELVLNVENEKESTNFKIIPQFTNTSVDKTVKLSSPARQRKKKAVVDVEGSETMNYVCPYCGNNYSEKAKLSLHLKIHTKEKPHQCEICFKRFGQTPQLARHMNSHTGSRPFLCKFCSASFADPSTRIKHERIHTNERPYQCTICDKAFSYSNVLKVHMMTHTGEKPHTCKYCKKQFSQAHHKKKHERLHENANLKLIKTCEETQDII